MYFLFYTQQEMTAKNKNGAWKKVLYINHGYPDNYTDESFLDEMKKNGSLLQFCICASAFVFIQVWCTSQSYSNLLNFSFIPCRVFIFKMNGNAAWVQQ